MSKLFCATTCCSTGGGTSAESKWTEEDDKIFRLSDVAIGTADVNTGNKLFVQGNVLATGNITADYYFGNVALAEGLPTGTLSKWTLQDGNIFRDSLVTINDSSVNPNFTLYVDGNANVSAGIETSKLEVSGNVDCSNLNASLVVNGNFFVGDGGGLSNISGGTGSKWSETAGGQIFRNSNVGIGNSDPTDALVVNGNVSLVNNENQIVFVNGGNIEMEGNGYIHINSFPNTTNGLTIGGTPFTKTESNFISDTEIHTKLNSFWSHLGIAGEQNIKFLMGYVFAPFDAMTTVINTIDRDFFISDNGSGNYTISSFAGNPLPAGKKYAVFCQTCDQAGFNFANVVQGLPLLTTSGGQILFNVQTGDYTGFPSFEMINNPKQFMVMIFLNDF